jgi:uncharacterized membrane protein YdbT with pleckstrin-like domain
MLSEVEKYLESDERVVEMVFPSRLDPAYLKWFVISLLLVVAGGAGAVVAFYVDFAQAALFWGGLAVVGVGVVLGGIAELRRRFVMYHFTDRKVIKETGVLDKDSITVPYNHVREVDVDEDMEERVFGVGDLYVNTAGSDTTELVLNGLPEPERFKVMIDEGFADSDRRTAEGLTGTDEAKDEGGDQERRLEQELVRIEREQEELQEEYQEGKIREEEYEREWYVLEGEKKEVLRQLESGAGEER